MSDKNHDGVKVLHVIEELLFLGKGIKTSKKDAEKSSKSPDEIKNRVLLKIERAEIMSAMIAMRGENAKNEDQNHPL